MVKEMKKWLWKREFAEPTHYKVVMKKWYYWWLRRTEPSAFGSMGPDRVLQRFDVDDGEQVRLMLKYTAQDRRFRCYICYDNGSVRRIKIGRMSL